MLTLLLLWFPGASQATQKEKLGSSEEHSGQHGQCHLSHHLVWGPAVPAGQPHLRRRWRAAEYEQEKTPKPHSLVWPHYLQEEGLLIVLCSSDRYGQGGRPHLFWGAHQSPGEGGGRREAENSSEGEETTAQEQRVLPGDTEIRLTL